MGDDRWLDTSQFAELMSMNEQSVRDLCRDGKLEAMKVGKEWRIFYREPADSVAERKVREAVDQALGSVVASIDSEISKLTAMRDSLRRSMEGEGDA